MNVTCSACGAGFSVSPYLARKRKSLYCSRRCFRTHRRSPDARFWRRVAKRGTGCWEWTGGKPGGKYSRYGQIVIYERSEHGIACGRRSVPVHRFSWEIHNGPIPDGLCVCHHCDNPLCVNPDHLFLGTIQDNMDDRNKKNRHARHERSGRAKITMEIANTIRAEHAAGATALGLSRKHGLSRTAIRALLAGRTWRQ